MKIVETATGGKLHYATKAHHDAVTPSVTFCGRRMLVREVRNAGPLRRICPRCVASFFSNKRKVK